MEFQFCFVDICSNFGRMVSGKLH